MSSVNKQIIKVVAGLAVIVFFVVCFIQAAVIGTVPTGIVDILSNVSTAITITALISAIYAKWLWKYINIFRIPVLKKHYAGTLTSTFDGEGRDVELLVDQSFLTTFVTMKTGESDSTSTTAILEQDDLNNVLVYQYLNTPKASVRDRSCIHYGTARLVLEDKAKTLRGSYYTDRKTTGDIVLRAE